MKKFLLAIVFFAGFGLTLPTTNIYAQGELPIGASTQKCRSVLVRIKIENGQKFWQECSADNQHGCQMRFCNHYPMTSGDGMATWKKSDCNKYCVTFQEAIPIAGNKIKSITGESGTDLAMNYVGMIYKFGAAILGIIAVLVIVVSGVQMMMGGVEESNYTDAKTRLLQAILSLALLFSSVLILRTINPDFFT